MPDKDGLEMVIVVVCRAGLFVCWGLAGGNRAEAELEKNLFSTSRWVSTHVATRLASFGIT